MNKLVVLPKHDVPPELISLIESIEDEFNAIYGSLEKCRSSLLKNGSK
jgi:hypothetical protein